VRQTSPGGCVGGVEGDGRAICAHTQPPQLASELLLLIGLESVDNRSTVIGVVVCVRKGRALPAPAQRTRIRNGKDFSSRERVALCVRDALWRLPDLSFVCAC